MGPFCSAPVQHPWWMRRAVCLSMAITVPLSRTCFGSWSHTAAVQTSRCRRRLFVTMAQEVVVPRAAVSVVVRASDVSPVKYVLVQRGKEPNRGMWSLPGGKIELGEATLAAAQRELWEETRLSSDEWHGQPCCVSDSIHRDATTGEVLYHYVIAQCFCTLPLRQQPLMALDDAADAKWFTLGEMQLLQKLTPGVIQVIKTLENMYEKGLLNTTKVSVK